MSTTEQPAPLSPDELAEAKRYSRYGLVCELLDRFVDLVFLSVMAVVVARPLDDGLAEIPSLAAATPRLVGFYAIMFLAHVLISFPISFYSGYVIECRFGLSRQTFARWLTRYFKRTVLAAAFNTLLIVGLYWVIWTTGEWWWLVGAAVSLVVMVIVGQLVPVLILPLFYSVERLDDPELAHRLSRLAEGTGLSVEGVYRMGLSAETAKANALLAGLGGTRRVLLGDTLLSNFTPEEIEVVFAHEVGHHVHRHIQKLILGSGVYIALAFWACDRILAWWLPTYDPTNLPVYALPLLMLLLVMLETLSSPLRGAMSRYFERQCDWYALVRTRLVDAYVSAFTKLARQNKGDPDPHPLEVFWLHDHPTIRERLAMAERFRLQASGVRLQEESSFARREAGR